MTFLKSRIGAFAIVAIVICGCRSASIRPSGGAIKIPFGMGGIPSPPLYGQPQQAYDDDPQNQSLPSQAKPPSILPAPAASEVEDTPAVPSAKKSRWNLVPSGLRFSSTPRSSDVRQTGIKSDRNVSNTTSKQVSPATTDESDFTEEIVGSRHSGASSGPASSQSPAYRSRAFESPIDSSPNSNRGFRSSSSPSLDTVARPLAAPGTAGPYRSTWDDDTPVLLPPGN